MVYKSSDSDKMLSKELTCFVGRHDHDELAGDHCICVCMDMYAFVDVSAREALAGSVAKQVCCLPIG